MTLTLCYIFKCYSTTFNDFHRNLFNWLAKCTRPPIVANNESRVFRGFWGPNWSFEGFRMLLPHLSEVNIQHFSLLIHVRLQSGSPAPQQTLGLVASDAGTKLLNIVSGNFLKWVCGLARRARRPAQWAYLEHLIPSQKQQALLPSQRATCYRPPPPPTPTTTPPDTLQTAIQRKLAGQIAKPIEKSSGGAQRKQSADVSRRLQGGLAGGRLRRRRALIVVEICSFHRDSRISEMRVWATSRLPWHQQRAFAGAHTEPKVGGKKSELRAFQVNLRIQKRKKKTGSNCELPLGKTKEEKKELLLERLAWMLHEWQFY